MEGSKANNCPPVSKVKTAQNVFLHFTSNGSFYRAEIKALGISMHSQVECPKSVYNCFSKKVFCDASGIILKPHHCSALSSLKYKHIAKIHASRHSRINPVYARFVTENADLVHETFNELNSNILFLECQIQNLLSTLFSILARQFPSQVLSAILKRPIAALTNGDTLKEIVCSLKNVSMLTNLRHGEYFGTRPIVSYIDNQNKTSFGQIYPDGNVYSDIVFIEKYRSGRSLTFYINKRFYTYYNYSLVYKKHNVYFLSPTLAPIDINFNALDYQEIFDLFPASKYGTEDIVSMLRSINDANILHEQFTALFSDHSSSTSSADLNYVLSTASSAFKGMLFQLLGALTNPILNFFISILFCLSLLWALVLTIVFLKNLCSHVRSHFRANHLPRE